MAIEEEIKVSRFLEVPKQDQAITMLNVTQVRFAKSDREAQIAKLRTVLSSINSESWARLQ